MALLEVDNVVVRFGGIVALDGVTFDIPEGQIVGLIGPNGAGKTTLFNCLSRLYTPNEGDVRFEGKSILGLNAEKIAALGIGLAGGSFIIGVAYVSRWYPAGKQGTALGIFGAGNVGAAVTKFIAPFVMVAYGWQGVAQVWAVGIIVMGVLFYFLTRLVMEPVMVPMTLNLAYY